MPTAHSVPVPEAAIAPPVLAPPLTSRLAPPLTRAAPVSRERLLRRLAPQGEAPIVVIHAPAGYGKSTLLSQFAASDPRPIAWLTLDRHDDDPVVLLYELAHALGTVGAVDEDLLGRLRAGFATIVPLALPRLIAMLGERTEALVIVLDDVHLLRNPAALDVVRTLCDNAPPNCEIVLSGRRRPHLPLGRLRASGRLWELKAADLRMTSTEGVAMLRAAGVDVDDREGALVVQRTEGWAAAIYLAALILRGDDEVRRNAALETADDELAEYAREEILAGAAPEDADFLVRSSILDELRPDVCDVVLERRDSDERLRALADADLFVTRSDRQGELYRVHSLFRDMLQTELRTGPRGRESLLHLRASAAYRDRGDGERAVRHAVAAGDLEAAADLIWLFAPEYVTHGRSTTVTNWCSLLSADDLSAHPAVALARGWAALEAGDAEDAEHCATLALAGDLKRILPDGATIQPLGLLLRGTTGLRGRSRSVEDMERADAGLPAEHPLRAVSLYVLGSLAMLDDDRERARTLLEHAEQRAAGQLPTVYGLILAQQALLAIDVDDWEQAETFSNRAAAEQRAAGTRDYATQGLVPAVRALTLARRGARDQARDEADQAVRNMAIQRVLLPWLALETRLVLACAYAKLGDGGRARSLVRERGELDVRDPGPLLGRWLVRVEAEIEAAGEGPGGPDLTTAELRTLQYLPTHLSLREIGERLHITRNTVKTHTIAIYRKLGVNSRSAAVARGREVGLLE